MLCLFADICRFWPNYIAACRLGLCPFADICRFWPNYIIACRLGLCLFADKQRFGPNYIAAHQQTLFHLHEKQFFWPKLNCTPFLAGSSSYRLLPQLRLYFVNIIYFLVAITAPYCGVQTKIVPQFIHLYSSGLPLHCTASFFPHFKHRIFSFDEVEFFVFSIAAFLPF